MSDIRCPVCFKKIKPGQKMISWFERGFSGWTEDRGAVHLSCLANKKKKKRRKR